jgi:ABC-type transport system substrate-binding protein
LGFGSLWVTEPDFGAVVRIDIRRRAVIATIPVGTRPSRIIAAAGHVWVLDPVDRALSRIDPSTETVAQTIAVGSDPTDVVAGANSLWVANHGDDTVARIDLQSGRTQRIIRTRAGPRALAAAGRTVWIAEDKSGRVERLNAASGKITDSVRVGDAPTALALSGTDLWVLDPMDATVSRVDTRSGVVDARIALSGRPADLTILGRSVWVVDERPGALLQVSLQRSAVIDAIRLGGHPRALGRGAGLWIAVDSAGPSHRGGTVTTIPISPEIDSIDPAASNSLNTPSPQLLGLTNDGLVTLDHVAGPDGARLVPDLALALPVPSAHGRAYTFQLRPAIRYSTGQLVEPTDVTHSIERIFRIGSSAADHYEAIVGARQCSRHRATCDLSRGIIADDRARTVTFHLTHPDPDFLYKLGLAYADVLPASIPGREARAPLPATGPYLIARYLPRRELRLVRNPRFREWSAAAQPDGYPDQIVVRLGLTATGSAAAVTAGRADLATFIGGVPANTASFPVQHPRQVRVNPLPVTSFLFLNVAAPPFDDQRVRRALNFALDRGQIAKLDGGSIAARPTCQILPPPLAAYRRYCPYTRDPTTDGRWHGPDLARGKRLVRASGTAGMRVTVWDTRAPQFVINEGHVAVAALRRLGYRARLRTLPDSTFFTYTNDSRNRAQIIDGGWSLDYPSANDLIGKLTCRYFVPGNGPATTDASELCDPALDQRIAHASVLQTTEQPTANTLWTRIDRELTSRAIWLPTVTPNETDLISRRAGNYQYNPLWGPLPDQLWVR